MRRLALVLALCAVPRIAFADPVPTQPLQPVPPGDDKITGVHKGDPAPYDGQCFDQPTAVRWGNYLLQARGRLVSDVAYQYKLDQIDVQTLQKTLELERTQYQKVTAELDKKLDDAEKDAANPPFYKTFWFGTTVGVIATVALVAGTAALINATK